MTEPALKTVEGRITKIDFGTRMLQFRPDKEFAVDIFWSPNQDEKMVKFKDGYKARLTYEKDKLGKCWLSDIISTYKPNVQGKGSPQDQILIAKEVVFKALVELKWETFNPEKETYDSMCEDVIRNFEMMMPRFLKAGDEK